MTSTSTSTPGEPSPVGSEGGHRRSRLAPWRAAARLASRDVRHRPGRSLLVGLLVGLPVAALAAGAILVRTDHAPPSATWALAYGRADAVVSGPPVVPPGSGGPSDESPDDAEFADAVRRAYPNALSVTTFRRGPDGLKTATGGLARVESIDAPLDDPIFDGTYEVTSGRLPQGPGEVALTSDLLDKAGVRLGDRVELVLGGSFEVTGTVLNREWYDDALVVTTDPPATVHADSSRYAYVDLPGEPDGFGTPPTDPEALTGLGGFVSEPSSGNVRTPGQVAALYVIAGVALLMAAIVASAGFAVSARRQLRVLGIASATGGSPADLRRTVLLQGTVTGLVASVAGVALALAGTAAVRPLLDDLWSRGVGPLAVRPSDLLAAVALGTLAATGAAWLPARTAGRAPTLAALAGRRPQGRVPWAVPVVGAVAMAAGIVALGVWARQDLPPWGVGLAAAVTVVLGATAVAPLLVSWAEPAAARLHRGGRVAARGLARQRLRSSAVVAAVMAPVGLAVLAACVTATDSARESYWREQGAIDNGLAADQAVVVYPYDPAAADELVDDVRAVLPGSDEQVFQAVRAADAPAGLGAENVVLQAELPEGGGRSSVVSREVIVTTSDALRANGASAATVAAFEAGDVVIPGRLWPPSPGGDSPEGVQVRLYGVPTPEGLRTVDDPAVTVPQRREVAFASPETIEAWGAEPFDAGVVFTAPRPLTDAQREALDVVTGADNAANLRRYLLDPSATNDAGGWVMTRRVYEPGNDPAPLVGLGAFGATLTITLAVVAVALALTNAESTDERRLLEAIGLPPSVRRSVSAWQALLLPAMAVTLAVPVGLVVSAVVLDARDDTDVAVQVPWLAVAAIAVGLPLASGAITWVGATFTNRGRRDLAAAVVGGD